MAGLALMSAVMGLPLSAETSTIPADVIQIVVEGINPGSVTIERVRPDMRQPDAKLVGTMVSLAKGKPEELLKISEEFQKFMVLTTNTLQILTRTPGVGLVEQSFSSADSTNVSRGRYGWTPHFNWKHDEGESMPWVVPMAEIAQVKETRAESIMKSNDASRIGHENLLHNLGLTSIWDLLGLAALKYGMIQRQGFSWQHSGKMRFRNSKPTRWSSILTGKGICSS